LLVQVDIVLADRIVTLLAVLLVLHHENGRVRGAILVVVPPQAHVAHLHAERGQVVEFEHRGRTAFGDVERVGRHGDVEAGGEGVRPRVGIHLLTFVRATAIILNIVLPVIIAKCAKIVTEALALVELAVAIALATGNEIDVSAIEIFNRSALVLRGSSEHGKMSRAVAGLITVIARSVDLLAALHGHDEAFHVSRVAVRHGYRWWSAYGQNNTCRDQYGYWSYKLPRHCREISKRK